MKNMKQNEKGDKATDGMHSDAALCKRSMRNKSHFQQRAGILLRRRWGHRSHSYSFSSDLLLGRPLSRSELLDRQRLLRRPGLQVREVCQLRSSPCFLDVQWPVSSLVGLEKTESEVNIMIDEGGWGRRFSFFFLSASSEV